MNGAVIWSCAQERQALVWCEDQGAVALAHGAEAFVGSFPEVGDLVALMPGPTIAAEGETLRLARGVRVVERGHFPGIDRLLEGVGGGTIAIAPAIVPAIVPAASKAGGKPGIRGGRAPAPPVAPPNLRLVASA